MTPNAPALDLFSLEFKADPFPTYATLRSDHPVYCHHAPYGARIWYITRYEDVLTVLKDNGDLFAKDPLNARSDEKRDSNATPNVSRMINRNMLFADPPDHTRLRTLVNLAFTPRRVDSLAPRIAQIATSLLDQMAASPPPWDLMSGYAFPLPITVIMEMLGIPAADQGEVHEWSKAIIAPGRHGISLKERKRRIRAFVDYLNEMFAQRRIHPGDDLISALVVAEAQGERLSEEELSSMVALLFVTGYETVVNLLGNGALALMQHPEQLTRLLADNSDAAWDAAIEELLRYDGPVETSTTRWARQDVTLHGQEIKRGDIVRVVLTSANRDERQFVCPHQLDLQREDVHAHIAFGRGAHYCLGAPLARLEGRIALRALFTRRPSLQPATPPDELAWRIGVIFRGLNALPVAP
ncbi:cytochrome P450 [bacterium]|nr:cytochrome P450 [bacterium]